MRRYAHRTRWMIVAALVIGGASVAAAQEGYSKTIFGKREASCVVRITSDPAVLPLTQDLIEGLLASTPVSGEAAKRLLESKPEQSGSDVRIDFDLLSERRSNTEHTLIGEIRVILSADVQAGATDFLSEICQRLEQALAEVGAADEKQLRTRLGDVEEELERVDAQFKSVRVRQRELLDEAGQDNLSRQVIEVTIIKLEERRHDIELGLAGGQAREAAVARQIAKIGKETVEAVEKSAFVAEMAEVIQIREKQVEKLRAMIKAGQASQTDLGNLEEQLARIRAELARYRETASETAGAGLLPQLNKQLVELSVDSAKEEAVLAAVKTRLAEIRERRLLELSDRYEREVESQLELCERIVRELTVEQYELKARIRNLRRPEVVIIGDK